MTPDAALNYRFGRFELDVARFELRFGGKPIHLEPQVLSLLILMAANAERLVSKDEVIEKIWGGRFVSDAALASRIKSARRALGDDGKSQRFIRTVHAKGFRFVAPVTFHNGDPVEHGLPAASALEPSLPDAQVDGRPSLAVLPLRASADAGPLALIGDALADELIADLSRMRWLLVIARGSSFRFRRSNVDPREVGRVLQVRYCLSGSIQKAKAGLAVSVELARTSDSAVVWAERFLAGGRELNSLREEIVTTIVANLEVRIPQHEAQLAHSRALNELDSWSAYHRGIDLMYRFNGADNARAATLFELALAADPEFSRALGGLSFTRFQDAFMQYAPDAQRAGEEARLLADRARQCDPLDPFAYLNLGRSLWLGGGTAESIALFEQSIALSPNYAQAVYSKAFAEMTQCRPDYSDPDAALALRLSPLDPLRYAMLGVRCLSALMRGNYGDAAEWGERAVRSPGAHKHIAVIAALAAQLDGRRDKAGEWVAWARQQDPALSAASFLRSFPFAPSASRELIEATLTDLRL